ncbi:MAG: DUF5018 domain-containing protein [Bacteroidales bacterium]|nr:DUF5018 domain-containing protein [Bacteroidales bacterium]
MKKNIFIFLAVLLTILSGCHKPEVLVPLEVRQGLNSLSAQFSDGEFKNDANAKFTLQISNPDITDLVIPIPWFYPVESTNPTEITKMKVSANLDDNTFIEPGLAVMDLTKQNPIKVTKADGTVKSYRISGVRTKSNKCAIINFTLNTPSITGVIDEDAKSISLITIDNLGMSTASIAVSAHATISPDPSVPRDYSQEVVFTVTAHDGVSKANYTVKKTIPPKINYGFRPGSQSELWANDLSIKYGITNGANKNHTLAAIGNHLILSVGTEQHYFNSTTGEKLGLIAGSMDLTGGAITADKAGNMLLCNNVVKNAVFKIWKTNSVTKAPEEFITMTYTLGKGVRLGAKISVQGDVTKNAIITVPTWAWANPPAHNEFMRWVITDGVVGQPEAIVATNIVNWNSGNTDVVYGSTNTNGNYFITNYGGTGNKINAVNGATNNGVAMLATSQWGANSNFNTVDAVEFNKATYVAVYGGMHFTYSQCLGYMFDVTTLTQFTDRMDNSPSRVFTTNERKFGTPVFASSDILMIPSPDGYKLRLYYTDGNCRSLVAWEFDCIDK